MPTKLKKKKMKKAKPKKKTPNPQTCLVCGFEAFENHCKLICPNCGAIQDCSD